MKNNSIRIILAVMTLVIGASAEELLPKFLSVGFPVLLSAVPVMTARRERTSSVVFALAAGALEDALSGLPFMASASFFLMLAALVRWTHLPSPLALFAYPAYQLWLCLWVAGLKGSVFVRTLVALPVGAVTYGVVLWLLVCAERKAGVDEVG